jgi:hypothetical protein
MATGKQMLTKCKVNRTRGYISRMREMENAFSILVGNLKGRDHSEDLAIDGRIIL